ncbi:hypothetical protein FAIPA1_50073 [Frankia sp. AiPs1]
MIAFADSGNSMPFTFPPAAIASVRYTRAASTSPRVTLDRADLTSCSRVTGVSFTPAAVRAFFAAAPQGTASAHSATFTSGLTRSSRSVMPLGLAAGTAMTSWLRTNTFVAELFRPLSVTVFMVAGLAAANTSAGAPAVSCVASVELPPKENFTVEPGLAASNCLPSVVNVPVSDAAANTVTVPVTPLEEALADGDGVLVVAPSLPLPPHPARNRPAPAMTASAVLTLTNFTCSRSFAHDGSPVHPGTVDRLTRYALFPDGRPARDRLRMASIPER